MSTYTIILLTESGTTHELLEIDFDSDDAAVDHVGSLPHPYAMVVRQGDRDVALFPPLGATLGGPFDAPEESKA